MPRVCVSVKGKNMQPYRFSLDRKVVRFGRAADNDIVIDCPSVSSHHCKMRRIEGGYVLEDLESTNGIKLDGDRMEIIDLQNGQDLEVGDAGIDFELTPEEKEKLAKEDHKPRQRAHPTKTDRKKPSSERPSRPRSPKRETDAPEPARPAATVGGTPPRPSLVSNQPTSAGTNFVITISLLFLAILAFYYGLASAHRSKYPLTKYPDSKGLWGDMFAEEDTLQEKKQDD